MLARWGRYVYRHRLLTLLLSAMILLASIAGLAGGGTLKGGDPPGEAAHAQQLIKAELPGFGASFTVIFKSSTLTTSDPQFRAAMETALAPLRADHRVSQVLTPYELPPPTAIGLVSRDHRQAMAVISVKDRPIDADKYYWQLRDAIHSPSLRVTATGDLAVDGDFTTFLDHDLSRAESVSLPLSLLLLLLVFGAVLAATLPLLVGVLAIVGGFGGVMVLSRVMDMSQYSLNTVTLIGLGVAIDYSLFIVNRFREELRQGHSVEESLSRAMATAGRAVVFSGIAVAVALSGLLIFSGTFLVGLGLGGAVSVGFAVVYAVTLLPAVLALLGRRVNILRLPIICTSSQPSNGLWRGLAALVQRRPLPVLLLLLLGIGFVASPARDLRLAGGDIRALPANAESRIGLEDLMANFPHQDRTEITVVVRFPGGLVLTPVRVGALYDLSHRIARIRGVLRVQSLVDVAPSLDRAGYQRHYSGPLSAMPPDVQETVHADVGAHIAVLHVLTGRYPSSDEARAIVHAIRAIGTAGDGTILVSGKTAYDVDQVAYITGRAPFALLYVLGMTYLILFLLLGSAVLPLKAILTDAFSILASFGVLVWIFQQGHLSGPLGFSPSGFLDPSVVVLIFCIIFGLSMDYEVLLVSRMQEIYQRTRDSREAVSLGLEQSGKLISGAAAIMVGVFLAFGLADVAIIKSMGIGLATAIGVDAFLVRQLVVPALMHLLGDAGWWAPRPMRRLHEALKLGEPVLPGATDAILAEEAAA